ncbi:DNA repair RAD51-like protein, putative, partial [Rhizoctonia solani AG-3 Rhs1AP]
MSTQLKRSIASLQINPSHRSKLIKNGYSTVADIQAISAEELSRDLGLSLEDANTIIAAAQPQPHVPLYDALAPAGPSPSQRTQIVITGSQTAAALLKVPASATALSLGANSMNELLDGDHPEVKLVALPQLSYHVQTSAISPQARGKLLTHIKQQLTKACGTGQVAIVATTSMAVKLIDDQGQPANFSTGTKALLVPALGDGFSLASKTYRLVLGRHPHDGQRFARLVTAPARTHQSKSTNFTIKNGFIVDMET